MWVALGKKRMNTCFLSVEILSAEMVKVRTINRLRCKRNYLGPGLELLNGPPGLS